MEREAHDTDQTGGYVESFSVPIPPGTPLISLAAHAVAAYSGRILANFDGKARWKRSQALVRLYENLRRLDWRYTEYQMVSYTICSNDLGAPNIPPLSELQLRLVDKAEAFHQHTYATLAVLSMCMNMLRDHRTDQYPIGSITDFLKALKSRNQRLSEKYSDDIALLKQSTEFRSKHADHPERHGIANWYTTAIPVESGKVDIIYFKRSDPGDIVVYTPDAHNVDLSAPNFKPPIDCESWYVAPNVDRVYVAMQRVVIAAFALDELPSPGPPADPAPPGLLHLHLAAGTTEDTLARWTRRRNSPGGEQHA